MSESTRFAVSLHILTVLAYLEQEGVELASSAQIAKSVNTSAVVIRNLLRALKEANLVQAKEGRGGGVWLARPPAQISLKEVFLAVESERILSAHGKPSFKPCPVSRGMREAFQWVAQEVDGAVAIALQSRTLKDMLRKIPQSS